MDANLQFSWYRPMALHAGIECSRVKINIFGMSVGRIKDPYSSTPFSSQTEPLVPQCGLSCSIGKQPSPRCHPSQASCRTWGGQYMRHHPAKGPVSVPDFRIGCCDGLLPYYLVMSSYEKSLVRRVAQTGLLSSAARGKDPAYQQESDPAPHRNPASLGDRVNPR